MSQISARWAAWFSLKDWWLLLADLPWMATGHLNHSGKQDDGLCSYQARESTVKKAGLNLAIPTGPHFPGPLSDLQDQGQGAAWNGHPPSHPFPRPFPLCGFADLSFLWSIPSPLPAVIQGLEETTRTQVGRQDYVLGEQDTQREGSWSARKGSGGRCKGKGSLMSVWETWALSHGR